MKSSRISLLLLLIGLVSFTVPVFAQDATPEATASADVQTFTAPNGTAAVQFPTGWVSKNGNDSTSVLSVSLANTQSALGKELLNKDDVFDPGEVHVEVATIALSDLVKTMPAGTLTTAATPLEVLQALMKQGSPSNITFAEPGTITINDTPAARMNFIADKRGEGQLLLTILDKQWVAALIVYAAPNEGDKWDITARNILASIKITPIPEATSESSSTNKAFSSQKGNFTVAYPANLNFEDQSDVSGKKVIGGVFFSDARLKNSTPDDDFRKGDVYIQMFLLTVDNYSTALGSLIPNHFDSSTTPVDFLRAIVKDIPVPNLNYGIVQPFSLSIGEGAQVDVSGKGNNEEHIFLIKRNLDGVFIFLVVRAAPNELETAETSAISIAASLTRNTQNVTPESTAEPLALVQTAKTANGLGLVAYPDKWLSRQSGDQSLYLANSQSALDKSFGSSMAAGEANILVSVSTTADYIKEAKLPITADATPLQILQVTIKAVGDTIKFDQPEETQIGDKLAARVDFHGDGFEGTAWLIEYQKGALITMQLLAASSESTQWQSVALAIAQSVRSTD